MIAGRSSSAGLMATVAIAHGPGDAAWAAEAARAMRELETRFNALETPGEPSQDENAAGNPGAAMP